MEEEKPLPQGLVTIGGAHTCALRVFRLTWGSIPIIAMWLPPLQGTCITIDPQARPQWFFRNIVPIFPFLIF